MRCLPLLVALALSLPAAGRAAEAGTAPTRYTPPASIDSTGEADVTVAMQQFLDEVPNGATVVLGRNARYRIDGTLTLTDRHDLVLDGNGATLHAVTEGDRDRAHVRIIRGNDLLIRDLTIIGAHAGAGIAASAYRPDKVGQQGFDLHGVARLELAHVKVRNVFGDTIYIGRADGVWSSQVWVHDSDLAYTGRHGITVTGGRYVVIEHNRISDTRYSTFDLEPNSPTWGAMNILIADNEIGPGRLLFLSAHGAGPVDSVVVENNRLVGRPMTISVLPPRGSRRSGFYVLGNSSDLAARRTPLQFERIDDVVVRDNHQPLDPRRARTGEVGVEAVDVCGLEVVHNDFGPESTTTRRTGPDCANRPPRQVPDPPFIPARARATASGVAVPDTDTGTSTATTATTATSDDAPSGAGSIDLTVFAAGTLVGALTISVLLIVRRLRSN